MAFKEPQHLKQRSSIILVFFGALAVIVAAKWSSLAKLPVWDEAFGVFPAAILLNQNGFDISDLLRQNHFVQGGPNVHSLSLVTWVTAFVLRASGSGATALVALHALHFAVAAFTVASLYVFARPVLGSRLSATLSLTVLLFPLFLTQCGQMYLEMPLACCVLRALIAWRNGRPFAAAVWGSIACWVKAPGLAVVAALCAASALERRPLAQRLRNVMATAIPALLIVGAQVVLVYDWQAMPAASFNSWFRAFWWRLAVIPDLFLLFWSGLFVTAWRCRPSMVYLGPPGRACDGLPGNAVLANRSRFAAMLTIVGYCAFFLGVRVHPHLPRYCIVITPLLFLVVIDVFAEKARRHVAYALLSGLSAVFVVNRAGAYYPAERNNDFSLAERSAECDELGAAQRSALRALTRLDPEVPVFYGLPEHYCARQPELGYVERPLAQGHCLFFEAPYSKGNLDNFPPHFYVVSNCADLGGKQVASLLKQARLRPDRNVELTEVFSSGRYSIRLYEISQRPAADAG